MSSIVYPNTVAPAAERRTISIAVVAALHIAVIYTILAALDIVPSPIPEPGIIVRFFPTKPTVQPPPQPTIAQSTDGFVKPSDPTFPPPDFQVDRSTPGGGLTNPPPGGQTDTFMSASSVPGTHTIPAFPPLDRRLGHEGTVQLTISIDAGGNVIGASIDRSSGYDSLDAAAIAWVKDHWRYRPAMRNGVAIASSTQASVVFQLTR
jgi:protein TonB